MTWIIRTRTHDLKLNTSNLADLYHLLRIVADVSAVIIDGIVWLD